jgi:phage terminase small subunit
MPPRRTPLSAMEVKFCLYFVENGENASKAARSAGYSEKSAGQQGHKVLQRPQIKEFIQHLKDRVFKKLEASAERTLQELVKLAYSDIRELISWDKDGVCVKDSTELGPAAACIKEVKIDEVTDVSGNKTRTIQLKTHDKGQALGLLARHFKLLPMAGIQLPGDGAEKTGAVLWLPDNGR